MHDRTKDGINDPPERLRPEGAPLIKEGMDESLDEEIALKERALKAWQRALEEIERLKKEKEWLIQKYIEDSDNINAIWCNEDEQKKYLIQEMQQALKGE